MRFFFIILVFASIAWRCVGDERRRIESFYFPAQTLQDGLVYEYDIVSPDSSAPEYWYYNSIKTDSGLFLNGAYYDRFFRIGQITREKITPGGVLSQDYFLYEPDTNEGKMKRIEADIASPDVFPFSVKDSTGVFLFSLRYRPAGNAAASIYLIRNRRFMGAGPDFVFKGKNYPTIRFGLREVIGNEQEGAAEIEGRGEEIYAEGIGLAQYRKNYGDKLRYEYRLKDIYPMDTLIQKAQGQIDRQE